MDDIDLYPVPLSRSDLELYYEGHSNATIWPLYHDAVEPPVFHRHWRDAYRSVNQRFAAAADRVAAPGATVWVHDYQLQLVPAMLRARRPDLRIGFFLHIPFPPIELFMQLPGREEVIRGLLGADLVGFQTPLGAQNFLHLAHHLLGLRRRGLAVEVDGRTVRAGSFPVSIDVAELEALVDTVEVKVRVEEIRAELGHPKTLILSVDRLDYTKGITHRLAAYRELLAEGRLDVPETVLVQVATPSRERVEHYARLRENVERDVGRINGEYGADGRTGRALPAPVVRAHRARRAVPGGRRDGGDPAARRHEPGREGVRRRPDRLRRRPGAVRVRRGGPGAARGVPVQSRTTSTASRTPCCARPAPIAPTRPAG